MSELFRYNWELKRDNTVEDLLVENIKRRSIFKFNYELEPVDLSNTTLHQQSPSDGQNILKGMPSRSNFDKPSPSVSFAKVANIDSDSSIVQNTSQTRIKRPSTGQFQIDLYLEDSPQKKFRSLDSISTFSLQSSNSPRGAGTDSELDSIRSMSSVKTVQLDLDRGVMMQLPFSMRETVGGSLCWEFCYDANLTD
jgi:hypothetical protein